MVKLGGKDDKDIVDGMSAAYALEFQLPTAAPVTIDFMYQFHFDETYESNEYGQVLVEVNGELHGLNGKSYIKQIKGKDPGVEDETWYNVSLDVGYQAAGKVEVLFVAYSNQKVSDCETSRIFSEDKSQTSVSSYAQTQKEEEAIAWFDDIVIKAFY